MHYDKCPINSNDIKQKHINATEQFQGSNMCIHTKKKLISNHRDISNKNKQHPQNWSNLRENTWTNKYIATQNSNAFLDVNLLINGIAHCFSTFPKQTTFWLMQSYFQMVNNVSRSNYVIRL